MFCCGLQAVWSCSSFLRDIYSTKIVIYVMCQLDLLGPSDIQYILILTQLNKYFKCPLNYDTLITQIEIHYLLVLQCGISTAYTVVSSLSLWMGQLSIITDAVFGTQLYGLVYSDVTVGASKRMPVAWRHRVWVSGQSGELGGRQQRMRRGWAEDTLGGQLLICESLFFFLFIYFFMTLHFLFPHEEMLVRRI